MFEILQFIYYKNVYKYFMMLIEYEILSRNDSVALGTIIAFHKSQDFN